MCPILFLFIYFLHEFLERGYLSKDMGHLFFVVVLKRETVVNIIDFGLISLKEVFVKF